LETRDQVVEDVVEGMVEDIVKLMDCAESSKGREKDIQVDQDLSRTRLRSIELLDLGGDAAGLVIDKGLVLLWNFDSSHDCNLALSIDSSEAVGM
jgi:hypothetical protein